MTSCPSAYANSLFDGPEPSTLEDEILGLLFVDPDNLSEEGKKKAYGVSDTAVKNPETHH